VPPRAVGCDFVRPVEQLGVYSVAHDQAINMILARATAFVALDAQNGELANDIAEGHRAVAGHHNLPFLGVVLGSASEAATHLTPRDEPREHNAGSSNTNGDDDHAQPFTQAHDRLIPVSVT
jgi:hypothetical protein